ncbi:4-oxalocrotonate tautomerase [Actinobacillus succinogenes]|uniref:4-oxalocrotonate tautomerase n=1 Tax=Actinobacillus succinogenes (strain ATCC 55618 / DSM 22257 / CCUG 43843 / 130Z) TaxID=339671 RepID=A6VKL7_ACTSZ|nr:tautomerase family protein [Actinobacillus succinogenes]ABR73514.1 4-oxalocrotonate tautomerase [Actinobacillus succinogenes 130Z]PHI40023.1 4-oxalocrotonate tautomerase [Actinobacillus succinogenes]
MPHISIKCYPKGLNAQELQRFADDLTAFVSERLHTPEEWITIDYQEMPADEWKEKVYDAEVKPNGKHFLRRPHYEL